MSSLLWPFEITKFSWWFNEKGNRILDPWGPGCIGKDGDVLDPASGGLVYNCDHIRSDLTTARTYHPCPLERFMHTVMELGRPNAAAPEEDTSEDFIRDLGQVWIPWHFLKWKQTQSHSGLIALGYWPTQLVLCPRAACSSLLSDYSVLGIRNQSQTRPRSSGIL